MKVLMEHIKSILHYFSIITVAVMIVAASYITIFHGAYNTNLEVKLLWQILLVSFFCAFSYLFFYKKSDKPAETREFILRFVLCYIYVNIVVMGLGFWFKWFDISSIPMVIGMFIAIIVAFMLITGGVFLVDKKTTDEINKKLKERNGEE